MRKNPQVFLNRKLSGKEVNQLYNSSRVILNLVNPQNELSFNPRLLEILGSGGTPVTRFTEDTVAEFPYLTDYCYRGKEDIIGAIDYALEHPLEINIEAHVLQHSFSERVKHLLE
jgi:spore maturation protein CgeB